MKKKLPIIPFSPLRINGRFYNFKHKQELEVTESLLPSIRMYVGSLRNFCRKPINLHEWIDPSEPIERSEGTVITWLGHATVLIQVDGINILTDPLFGTPSPIYRRILPFGMVKANLPPIDVVLLSHSNHKLF